MKRFKNNEQGLTLVEVLAALTLASLIGIVAYSIFFGSFNTYSRVMEETEIRNEADYIMALFINEFFTLKTTEITAEQLPEVGTNNYYLETTKGKLGIIDSQAIINDKPVDNLNDKIVLTNESKISRVKGSNVDYEIVLVLESGETGRRLELTSILSIINDREEEENEGSEAK